ncbi:MAG TPA: VgrG-related protein [Gemmatimonadales bacterium]|jgi:uncharacterized protein involved in type VI secretion and phage assembly
MADQQNLISQFYLELEGLTGPPLIELQAALLSVSVESSLHLPDVATLRISDTSLRWIDEKALEPGKRLKVSAKGAQSASEHPLFEGDIIELEPDFSASAQHLVVRAFDALHRLARGKHVRSFQNVSDGDLVQKLAGEVGLRAKVGQTSVVHPYVFQNNQSNLEFLQDRAAALGFVLFVHDGTLHCEAPAAEGDPIEMKWAENLTEFRPRLTTVGQVTASTVRGWDPDTRQAIVGRVQNGNGTPEVGESRKAGQLAQSAFNLEAPTLTADRPVRTQAEADRLAQAMADRHSSRYIEAEGVCIGDARIVAGTALKLIALGDRFSGKYVVTAARHTYSATDGYKTHFTISGQHSPTLLSLLAPGPNGTPTKGLVVGIVTDNQDPDGRGRVKVKFPWLTPDHASHWARVVSVGAGPERGIQFLPEINDEVLVGFEQDDVHHPYVLGGLWNGQDKPPLDTGKAVSGGKVQRRVIRSRTGHMVTLDDNDGGGGIKIEDAKGNTVELDTATNALNAKVQGDITLEATGSIKLKATGAVEVNGMGVKVNGGGGTVDVSGSVINLN